MTMTSLKEKEKPDNSDSFNLFSAVFKQKSMFNFFFKFKSTTFTAWFLK